MKNEITSTDTYQAEIQDFTETFVRIENELAKSIVGMHSTVTLVLSALFAGGHVLLEGVPGLGKTLLVKSVATALGVSFKRVQFTPDLMPSDITGTQVLSQSDTGIRDFSFRPGPLFAHLVLADEINRATAKTQSALLEAMEEHQVTVLGETYKLPKIFFVLATQNPLEQEGTYSLPEAQLDRFLMKLHLKSPSTNELKEILIRTTGSNSESVTSVFSEEEGVNKIISLRKTVRNVFVANQLQDVLVRMISALNPLNEYAPREVSEYIKFGPGPRGAQAVLMVAKTLALRDQRINLDIEDIREAFIPCLRHRIILNFKAESEGITADEILFGIRNAK
jgi:MoxR-like ATPase